MQRRVPFTFSDISGECEVETDCFRVDDGRERRLGARVRVPRELRDRYPYNGSAYGFLQELRSVIFELGIVVFPDLPVNRTNHTLAQRAPNEHSYSQNPYPGLLLIDNSQGCALYHARTCRFDAVEATGGELRDAPMYAFNEVGLLEHLRSLDEQRGGTDLSDEDLAQVKQFLLDESRPRGTSA